MKLCSRRTWTSSALVAVDMRYEWLVVRLEAIVEGRVRELVFDAWRMVVPKKLAALSDDELRQLGAERSGIPE